MGAIWGAVGAVWVLYRVLYGCYIGCCMDAI